MWQFIGVSLVSESWIIGGVIIAAGALFLRVFLPSLQRFGYEKLVIDRKSKHKDQKRQSQIRMLLKRNLTQNLSVLQDIERDMQGRSLDATRKVPAINVDISLLKSIAGLPLLEVLDDIDTYIAVDDARVQLVTGCNYVTRLVNMYFKRPRDLPGPTTPPSLDAADNLFYGLARATLTEVQQCQSKCQKALKALERHESIAIR
jgi:hypothetical protein